MPQMKPMNWLLLIFYFLSVYLLMNNFLYFFHMKYFNNNEKIEMKYFKNFNLMW